MLFVATSTHGGRPEPLNELYSLFGQLNERTGGPFYLDDADASMEWPERGIYVFFDHDSDLVTDSPSEWRVTRIGTVGVAKGSSSTLWTRLRSHRGTNRGAYAGGGSHRGSIFRQHVGRSLIERDSLHEKYPDWGTPLSKLDRPTPEIRQEEHPLEVRVSRYIRTLPFLVIDVPGESGPNSDRSHLEAHSIALLSHHRRTNQSLHDADWLGNHSPKREIYRTGLWNIQHVSGLFSPAFTSDLKAYIEDTGFSP